MSTSIDDILALINSGGDPTLQQQDIGQQLAIARALKNRNVSPVMSSGRATLPNVSGILSNNADRNQGAADESRLMSDRLRVQQAQTNRAAAGVAEGIPKIAGVRQFDSFEDSPAAQLPMQAQPKGALEEQALLQGATVGAPAVEGAETLRKYALAKAVQQQRAGGKGVGGGTTTLLQLTNRNLSEHPDWTYDQAMQQAISDLETFTVQDVNGGKMAFGNRNPGTSVPVTAAGAPPVGGAAPVAGAPPVAGGLPRATGRPPTAPGARTPLSTVQTEALAKSQLAAAQGEGTTVGTTEAERVLNAPKAKAMVDGMVATAQNTLTKIGKIKADPALARVTGWMGLIPNWPGSDSSNVEAKLQSLTGALAIDTLQDIRRNNPTGGAVGNVSDKDMDLLKNSMQSLARAQSDDAIKEALNTLEDRYSGMIYRLKQAYEGEYGSAAPRTNRPSILAPPGAPKVRKFTRVDGKLVEVQ